MTRGILFVLLAALTGLRIWFVAGSGVTASEAYFWLCGQRLEWAFFDGPPGTAALIALTSGWIGDGPLGLRIAFPVIAALATIGVWLFVRSTVGDRAAAVSAVAINAVPAFNMVAVSGNPGLPAFAAGTIAAWAAVRAIQSRGSLLWWTLAGAAVGLAMQFRYESALLIPGFLLLCFVDAEGRRELRRPGLALAILIAVACATPQILWNAGQNWAPLAAASTLRSAMALSPGDFAGAAWSTFLVWSPPVFVWLVGGLVYWMVVDRKSSVWRPGFALAAPFLLLAIFRGFHGEPVGFEVLVAGALALGPAAGMAPKSHWSPLVASITILAASVLSAAHLAGLVRRAGGPEDTYAAIRWNRVISDIKPLVAETRLRTGKPAFVIAKDAEMTALFAFHAANLPAADRPEVFVRESQNLASQFGLWPRYDDFVEVDSAPDEFFAEFRAVNPYVGRSAFYLTDENEGVLPQAITNAFAEVRRVGKITFQNRSGGEQRVLSLYFCSEYQTLSL